MSLEENKELVRRFVAAAWTGDTLDPEGLADIVSPDFVDHSAPPDLPPGLETYKQFVRTWHTAFRNITHVPLLMIAEGDKVVEQWSAEGDHVGDFMGIPATNRHGGISGISTYQVANGKIVRRWGNADDLGMLRSIGVIPS